MSGEMAIHTLGIEDEVTVNRSRVLKVIRCELGQRVEQRNIESVLPG
jgi:hypothetical protein